MLALRHDQYVRQAFKASITVLGERTTRILIEDLRNNGVYLNDPDLTLDKIVRGLKEIIGLEATEVIIHRVMI